MLWRRFRRKTFAPNRPVIWPEQYGLVMLTGVAFVFGIVVVVIALNG